MNQNLCDVTVMVSTFNRARYLRECLDSLLAQTRPARQIIVVDDGSSDGTSALLAGYGTAIETLRQDNAGKPTALNRAFARATGAYLWIFDDDDVALPDALARHLAVLDRRPALDFTYSTYFRGIDGPDGRIQAVSDARVPRVEEDVFLIELLETCFLTTQGMLIRRHRIPGGYLFDPTLIRSQDYELFVRLARTRRGAMVEGPTFIRRYHDGPRGSASDRFATPQLESKWYHYEKLATAAFFRDASLAEFLPRLLAARVAEPAMEYRALGQKAAILARKGLWEALLVTLERLGALRAAGVQPDPAMPDLFSRALRKDLAIQELIANQALANRVIASIRRHLSGAEVRAWARGLWFTLHEAQNALGRRERRATVWLAIRLLGLRGLVGEVGIRLRGSPPTPS